MACGLVLAASHLAGKLVPGCRLALAGPSPCTTHENELAATRPEPFAWVYRLNKSTAHPGKDLHTSRTTAHPGNGLAACSHSSCKNRRKECRLSAKKREGAPEGAVFCAPQILALPTQVPLWSVKCAAFNADLRTRHRHPAGLGVEGGEAPPPSPTQSGRWS